MTLPRRIVLLLVVALMMVAMTVVSAAPALAVPPAQAQPGLAKAYANSGGKSPVPICDIC